MPTIVQVTVNTSGTTHSIAVNPDPVIVAPGVHGVIRWEITNSPSDGWRFQPKGIDIAQAGSEFDHPGGGGTPVFTWNNNHTRPGNFKYTVRVQSDSGTAELDPFIVNN